MNRSTLRVCPPNLRQETLISFERRIGRLAEEHGACAEIADQLDIPGIAVDFREIQMKIDATRLVVAGCA